MKFNKFLAVVISALVIASFAGCGQTDTGNIDTGNIDTGKIDTGNIDTGDIDTGDVQTDDVNTGDVDTGDIDTNNKDKNNTDSEKEIKEETSKTTTEPEKPNYEGYADILSEKGTGYFELIYIDDDDVAELAYYDGFGSRLDQISLYTIYNGEAVYLDDLGAYRSLAYSERNNRIFGYTGTNADDKLEAEYTYMIKDGKLEKAPDHKGYTASHAGSDGYEISEENLSRLVNGELK